jgi:hypothetical protein
LVTRPPLGLAPCARARAPGLLDDAGAAGAASWPPLEADRSSEAEEVVEEDGVAGQEKDEAAAAE